MRALVVEDHPQPRPGHVGQAEPLVVPGAHVERQPVHEHDGQRRVGRADLLDLAAATPSSVTHRRWSGPGAAARTARPPPGRGRGPDPADRVPLGGHADRGAGGDQAGHPGGDADDAASPHGTLPRYARGTRAPTRVDDLVGDRAGRVRPVLRGRLAVPARAEQHHLVAGRDRVVADVDARTGPCTPGRRPCGAGRRATAGRPLVALRGTPSAYPSGTSARASSRASVV